MSRTWLRRLTAAVVISSLPLVASQPASASQSAPAGGGAGVLIVGGSDADEAYPFVARLLTTDAAGHVGRCTGTFVTAHGRTAVVTAAHCVSDPTTAEAVPAATVQVQAGSTHLDQLTTLAATSVDVFPTWDWAQGDDAVADVAVVNVKVPAGLRVRAVPLADWVHPNEQVRLLGWGKATSTATQPPAVLQQADSHVAARNDCAAAGITAGEFCVAPSAEGGAACSGDSGGPALHRRGAAWTLVGGVSRGTDEITCVGPVVYTDFVYYSRWIGRQLDGRHASPHPRPVGPHAVQRFQSVGG
ncbi:trypsin-like serine protease [Actinoplanes sp. NPDC049596]|uniref:S1 family peptidase n=1 Tax=unclassified Actinoplanes TaxID=2626549 RepID=UPI00341A16EF